MDVYRTAGGASLVVDLSATDAVFRGNYQQASKGEQQHHHLQPTESLRHGISDTSFCVSMQEVTILFSDIRGFTAAAAS
jgi:class 3 adenylate cyclase